MNNRRYWIISPNVLNDGGVDGWLDRIRREERVFIGYDIDKKHGNTFANTVSIGDVFITAQGAKDKRRLYLAGIIASDRKEDEHGEAFYRDFGSLKTEKQLLEHNIELDSANAYGDSKNPGTIYELKRENASDLTVMKHLEKLFGDSKINAFIREMNNLLRYKKQIILQGPPGTGKTRLAKELAREIVGREPLTEEIIRRFMKPGLVIDSATKYTSYTVVDLDAAGVALKLKSADSVYRPKYQEIVRAYNEELWRGGIEKGNDSYQAAIAKFIFERRPDLSDRVHLIQFHPSYTYEDFVRGITAKPNEGGNGILYEAENKLLGKLAKEALENYRLSQTDNKEASIEKWVEEKFEDFQAEIEQALEGEEQFPLSDSIGIFQVNADHFKYGKSWGVAGRINFVSFKKLAVKIREGNYTLTNKPVPKEESVHAHYRYTYYNPLLSKFIQKYP